MTKTFMALAFTLVAKKSGLSLGLEDHWPWFWNCYRLKPYCCQNVSL